MKKTFIKSRIIQFHHSSQYARNNLDTSEIGNDVILQIEPLEHSTYDFIAEVINRKDYEMELDLQKQLNDLQIENEKLKYELSNARENSTLYNENKI